MRKVLLVRWLFYVMSFLTVAAAVLLILDIWRYESQLAYKLSLIAMVFGMVCAGVVGFCFAMTKRIEKLEVYQGEFVAALRYTQGVVDALRERDEL